MSDGDTKKTTDWVPEDDLDSSDTKQHPEARVANDGHINRKKGFSLTNVADHFDKCNLFDSCNETDVLLNEYLKGYDELCAFFRCLGSVFKFVLSDVVSKSEILSDYYTEQPKEYNSLKSMLLYEIDSERVKVTKKPSGARTFLRLHRALLFIDDFMRKIATMSSEQKLSDVVFESYSKTLAPYHTWMVRKAVGIGMYTLTTREKLLEELRRESHDHSITQDIIKQQLILAAEKMRTVYNISQTLYENYELLDLP